MKFGELTIHLVSDGTIRFDGGAMFGVVPKVIWSRLTPPDRKNRILMGLDCLLIQTGGKNILVDTGVGPKHDQKTKSIFAIRGGKLLRSLKAKGFSAGDIDFVVITHLHFDHCGGNTIFDSSGELVATFPNAKYLVQRRDWEEATHPNERNASGYYEQDFVPLFQDGRLELLDGDTEIVNGVWAKLTDGHTNGHQVVLAESKGQKLVYLGDLVPFPQQVRLPYIEGFDLHPVETLNQKRQLLGQAADESWLLVFEHSVTHKAGYVKRGGKDLIFQPIDID